MSLLREIQKDAVDQNVNLAALLRKCKILGARLGSREFKLWVESELNGYKDAVDELPNYRILKVNSKGHFSGPFGSGLRNADLPLFCLPEEAREVLGHSYLKEPVAALESIVEKSDGSIAQEPWDPTIVAMFAQRFYQNMYCVQAWKVLPINQIIGVLDTIRNKILSFALEIEAESPDAGEAQLNSNPVPQDKIHQIFNTYVTGNVQNLATGSREFQQTSNSIDRNPEVFEKIIDAIQKLKNPNLTSLVAPQIEQMRLTHGTRSFKDHYLQFMSTLSDHIGVLGPVLAPYLPLLARFVS